MNARIATSLPRMAKTSATASSEMGFHRLDDFVTLHGSELPQVVKVGKGFTGSSVDQSVETGEILIIFKVERRKKKIIARQLSSGREICFPRFCDLKVELITDPSQDVYSTLDALVKLPYRYVRVLESITSFGILAGDVLELIREPPYTNRCDVRCLIVSLKDVLYVDLPRDMEGKFQALSNYGVLSVDEVLKGCSHPVNVNVVSKSQTTVDTSSKHATSLPIGKCGNIQLEYEIEEDTIFAISALKENRILVLPITLDISVAQFMHQRDFLICSGTEYKRLVTAIENDKGLHDKMTSDCVYYTSDPVKRYSLETLQFVSFPFDRKQMVVTTGCRDETREKQDHFCLGLDSPALQQHKHINKGFEPNSFSENEAPPLPPKMTLITTQGHISSKKDHLCNTESQQESEKQWTSSDLHGQREVPSGYLQSDFDDHGLFRTLDQSRRENTPLQLGSSQGQATPKMRILGDSFSESEEATFSVSHSKSTAYEPQVDVNANLSFTSGVLTGNKENQTLVDFLRPTQTPCYLSRSLPGIRPEKEDQERGAPPPRKPLLVMENDLSQHFAAEASEKPEEREEHTRQKYDRSFSEQSDDYSEENNNIDDLDFDYPEEFFEGFHSNVQYGRQGSAETAERDQQEELKSPEGITEGNHCRANGDNPKKKFFHSLTRKPRWFRQDASKPAKKDKSQTLKTKSRDVKIPPRHAASCEDILISSPRDDDFECMTSITKYLETKEKLTKALVHISRLQNKGQKDLEKSLKPESHKEFANVQEKSSNESRKESDVKRQGSQTQHEMLPFATANTPEGPQVSGLPVPNFHALEQSAPTWQHQNPRGQGESETNIRGLQMPNDLPARAANGAIDSESVFPPSYSFERANGDDTSRREGEDREPRHEDYSKTCPYCRFHSTDTFGEELSESAAKNELRKAILQMNWSEDEWMELTEIVKRKISDTKRIRHPYVNLASSREAPEGLPQDPSTGESSSYPKSNEGARKVKMPPYVNIDQGSGRPATPPYQNIARDTTQVSSSYNDVQRLASRSHGKPPIPTPRGERSSI